MLATHLPAVCFPHWECRQQDSLQSHLQKVYKILKRGRQEGDEDKNKEVKKSKKSKEAASESAAALADLNSACLGLNESVLPKCLVNVNKIEDRILLKITLL